MAWPKPCLMQHREFTGTSVSALVVHVGKLDADAVRIANIDLVALFERGMSVGNGALKVGENALGVIVVDAKTEVIETRPLSGIGRVHAEKTIREPKFTEIFSLISNWKSGKAALKVLGTRHIVCEQRHVVQGASVDEWLFRRGRQSLTECAATQRECGQPLHQSATGNRAPVIPSDEVIDLLVPRG